MTELPVVEQPPQHSGALLDYLARRMRSAGVDVLEPLGLRPRHLITLTVLRDHGASSQSHLAEVLDIDRTNLVGLLNELEDARLVERRRSTRDRRRHDVMLTEAGRRALAQAEMRLGATEDMVLAALSPQERETLHHLLVRAAEGLAGQWADRGCADEPPAR
ncbi:MAG TPA: MarR family winged helix-turn-helix transcriptional regulator [Solirubrobacteraceae bacterium]|jgi:DNA-binding MarR family transcriptional regulator